MGGSAPGSSTRCMQCRQRRKKCGSERPSCLRCVKSGLMCSGPSETGIFIHRDATNIAGQSDRAALKAAFSARIGQGSLVSRAQVETSLSASVTPKMSSFFSPINLEILDSLLSVSSTRTLYATIADEFKPRLKIGIFGGDRLPYGNPVYSGLAICTRALIPLASLEINLLDLGIFGVLAKYIGILKNDAQLVGLARSSYTLALGEFHQRLGHVSALAQSHQRDHGALQMILCLCLSLQLFEVIGQNGPGAGLEIHVDGALNILRMTGPEVYRSQHLRHVFSGFRGIVIATALRRRQKTFLAESRWLRSPFAHGEKTKVERLHDLALELPALLEDTDALHDSLPSASLGRGADETVQGYIELKGRFHCWLQEFESEEIEPLYWYADVIDQEVQPASIFDPVCVPLFPEHFQLRFQTGSKAGLLCHYWAFQLQLLMGIIDVLSGSSTHGNADKSEACFSDPELRSIVDEAGKLARLVLETIPYLASCLEGRIVAQGPFEVVTRYLEQHQRMTGVRSLAEYATLWQLLTAT